MPTYTYDHIHLRTRDPEGTARYYNEMFGAEILNLVQSDGQNRVDLDLNGLAIFIARVGAGDDIPVPPADPHMGLDHFGLRVDNLDVAAVDLKSKGAEFSLEPKDLRPGVRIAFVRAPDDVRIELLQRD